MNNRVLKIKGWILSIGILVSVLSFGHAQELEPIDWTIEVSSLGDGQFEVKFKAEIEEGWHIYSTETTEGQDALGPIPTSILFEENELVRFVGEVGEKGERKEEFDPQFQMELYSYEGEVTFIQRIGVRKNKTVTLKGEIEFMACDDEKCIFPDPEVFEIVIENL